jgi:uncharacterized coiled-coil protein SlyX
MLAETMGRKPKRTGLNPPRKVKVLMHRDGNIAGSEWETFESIRVAARTIDVTFGHLSDSLHGHPAGTVCDVKNMVKGITRKVKFIPDGGGDDVDDDHPPRLQSDHRGTETTESSAALRETALFRMTPQRELLNFAEKGAIQFQAWVRGYNLRKLLATIKVQRTYRQCIARKKFMAVRSAAITIQRAARSRTARGSLFDDDGDNLHPFDDDQLDTWPVYGDSTDGAANGSVHQLLSDQKQRQLEAAFSQDPFLPSSATSSVTGTPHSPADTSTPSQGELAERLDRAGNDGVEVVPRGKHFVGPAGLFNFSSPNNMSNDAAAAGSPSGFDSLSTLAGEGIYIEASPASYDSSSTLAGEANSFDSLAYSSASDIADLSIQAPLEDHQTLLSKLNKSRNDHRQTNQLFQQEMKMIDGLNKKLSRTTSELQTLRKERAISERVIHKLREMLDSQEEGSRKMKSDNDERVDEFIVCLTKKDGVIKGLEAGLTSRDEVISKMESEINEKSREIRLLNAILAERDKESQRSKSETDEKNRKLEELEARLAKWDLMIEELEEGLAKKNELVRTLQSEVDENFRALARRSSELVTMNQVMQKLKSEANEKNCKIKELEAGIAKKEDLFQKSNSEVSEKSQEIDRMDEELKTQKEEIKALKSEAGDKDREIKMLTAGHTKRMKWIDQLKSEVSEKSGTIEGLEAELRVKNEAICTLETQLAEKQLQPNVQQIPSPRPHESPVICRALTAEDPYAITWYDFLTYIPLFCRHAKDGYVYPNKQLEMLLKSLVPEPFLDGIWQKEGPNEHGLNLRQSVMALHQLKFLSKNHILLRASSLPPLTTEDEANYTSLFQRHAEREYVRPPRAAVAMFLESLVPKSVVKRICNMVKPVGNRMDELQSVMAMHLIVRLSKTNLPLPETLPHSLQLLMDQHDQQLHHSLSILVQLLHPHQAPANQLHQSSNRSQQQQPPLNQPQLGPNLSQQRSLPMLESMVQHQPPKPVPNPLQPGHYLSQHRETPQPHQQQLLSVGAQQQQPQQTLNPLKRGPYLMHQQQQQSVQMLQRQPPQPTLNQPQPWRTKSTTKSRYDK